MTKVFWLFIVVHLAVFTLLPWLLYSNLPLDCIEMHSWGQQWAWGYHKHPPLPAWIARGSAVLGGASPVGLYLMASLCVATTFWAVWRLGRSMVGPAAALIAVVLLECSYYFNLEAMNLNNNTVLYALWALSVLAFYHAVRDGHWRSWLALGVCVGLGLLTKYSMAVWPIVMAGFVLVNHRGRATLKTPGPYLAAVVALLIFLPHLSWAIEYEFPTLKYAATRSATTAGAWGRLWFPLEFAAAQALAVLPILLVALPITGLPWRLRPIESEEDRFDLAFLATTVFAPFLTIVAISVLLNARAHSMWGSHLWPFAGLLLVFALKLDFRPLQQRQVLIGCGLMVLLYAGATVGRIELGPAFGHDHREHFPGGELARRVERVWGEYSDDPLPIVAGEGWLAGNVGFYADSQPKVYGICGEPVPPTDGYLSRWVDDRELSTRGGVFLWDPAVTLHLPEAMRRRAPSITSLGVLTVPRDPRFGLPPLRIGVAVIPPDSPRTARRAGPATRR